MKVSEKYEKLLEFIYHEYKEGDALKSRRGEYATVLASNFVAESGIDLGDVDGELDAIRLLKEKGWAITSRGKISTLTRIKLTASGIEHVEERQSLRKPHHGKDALKVASSVAEIIGRDVKGFTGR